MELTSSDVVNAIRSQNRLVPSGKVGGAPAPDDQQFTFTIQLQGRLTSEDEFRDLVINTKDGGLIRLRDVGEVELGGNSYEISAVNLEGNPSVSMAISQLGGQRLGGFRWREAGHRGVQGEDAGWHED